MEPDGQRGGSLVFGADRDLRRSGNAVFLSTVSKGRAAFFRSDDFGGRSGADGDCGNHLFQRAGVRVTPAWNRARDHWSFPASLARGKIVSYSQIEEPRKTRRSRAALGREFHY